MLLRSTSLAAVAMLLLALAAPSLAVLAKPLRIVPQVSIRGVQVGMTGAEVQRTIGRAPDTRSVKSHPVLGKTRVWKFGTVTVTFDGTRSSSEAITVVTAGRKERTAKGVGVGSTEAAVRAGVPGARCLTELGYRHCVVGVQKRGQIVTDFSIGTTGRVTRVLLGRVID